MAEFKDNFWGENGLEKPDLICLRQDADLYKSLLFQPTGHIEFDNIGIRFTDNGLAERKFTNFLNKALDENVELAITPEYSCPWDSIENLFTSERFPNEGKVWIIGCQSITPQRLRDFIGEHTNKKWIYDEDLVANSTSGFFNPVCILFQTKYTDGRSVNVVIIQFKTDSFGGEGAHWERDNMIKGNTFYIVDNEFQSTRLVVLICSDTLATNYDFCRMNNGCFLNNPLLLVHIQLNQAPMYDSYKSYRNHLFANGDKVNWNKEIICLNWAKGVTYTENDTTEIFNKYGGSAWYFQTTAVNTTDDRINTNHQKGLYYTYWTKQYSHIYFLNYCEHVFLIESTKPSQQNAHPAQRNRSGVLGSKILSWNNAWTESLFVDDGFTEACNDIVAGYGELDYLINENNRLSIERIIELTSGSIEVNAKWDHVHKLKSFSVENNEINKRNTFTQDPDISAAKGRKDKIIRYAYLKHVILTTPNHIPEGYTNPELEYRALGSHTNSNLLNLHSDGAGISGTAIFLGVTIQNEAIKIKEKIEEVFTEGQQGKQIYVWWEGIAGIQCESNANVKPTVNENVSESRRSFKSKSD